MGTLQTVSVLGSGQLNVNHHDYDGNDQSTPSGQPFSISYVIASNVA